MENFRKKTAMQVFTVGITGNLLLFVMKLLAGLLAHSDAMVSDAVQSASDVFSAFIVIIGITLAGKTPDKEHPYGHERMECVAAILLATLLCLTGLSMGYNALNTILSGDFDRLPVPDILPLIVAVISIGIKEGLYRYTVKRAKAIDSGVLMAAAWDHRSDALSSIGTLLGVAGARLGFPAADAIACLLICILIIKTAWQIFRDAVDKMVDKSCDEALEQEIRVCALTQEGVRGVPLLHTRVFGDRIYVDMEIHADGNLPLYDAHSIAERVHNAIENKFAKVKHIMVHVEPCPVVSEN